jgi:hypothetical protein
MISTMQSELNQSRTSLPFGCNGWSNLIIVIIKFWTVTKDRGMVCQIEYY